MTLHVVQGKDGLDRRAFSVGDVARMIDAGILDPDEPVELREGELVVMPAEKFAHTRAMQLIARKIHQALGEEWTISQENTLQLGSDTLVQPDFSLLASHLVRPSTEGYFVAAGPDLFIIEIADSSLLRDRTGKARLYASHEVREYWIIDLNGRSIVIHRDPAEGVYRSIERVGGDFELRPARPGPTALVLRASDLA